MSLSQAIMDNLKPSANIFVAKSTIAKAGRGVFASVNVRKGEVIEVCPVVTFDGKDVPKLKQTKLKDYYFIWHVPQKIATRVGICLGFGSLYNHSYEPNATYRKRLSKNLIEFIALRSIKKGEEITVNYNYGNPKDKTRLWIKSIRPARK